MKKLWSLLLMAGLTIICLLSMVACGKPELAQPRRLTLYQTSLTLKWTKIDYARTYTVSYTDLETEETLEVTVKPNSYDLSRLQPGEYSIKVRAHGDEDKYKPSDWSKEFLFTREAESGLTYKLINSSTEYEVTGMGTASENVVVESWYRGKPVTSIAKNAFSMNGRIKSIKLGENIKSIGDRAFYGCGELTSVGFDCEEKKISLTSIGQRAFQSCSKLSSFTVPKTVTEISDYTFSYCSSLTDITFAGNVTKIGNYAFSDCKKLPAITVPDTVESVGNYAFSGCTELKDVVLGDKVATLGDYAFYRCYALENVDLGASLKSIGISAFAECYKAVENEEKQVVSESGLKKIVIPDSVETIAYAAFYGCKLLENVTLGDGLVTLGYMTPDDPKVKTNAVFADTALWENADDIVYAGNWAVGCKNSEIEYIELKSNTAGIAAKAFMGCTKVYDIEIPAQVKYIGAHAFRECTGLMALTLGDEVRVLENYAFYGCELLETVAFGNKLQTIGSYAFRDCKVLGAEGQLELPESLTRIGTYAFHGTTLFASSSGIVYVGTDHKWIVGTNGTVQEAIIKSDGTVVGIADYAFYKTGLISVKMPDSVKYLGRAAFMECAYLGHPEYDGVTLSKSLKAIEEFTFYKCSFLTSVSIPSGVGYIGTSAFNQCASLENLALPSSVKSIGEFAFNKCSALKTVSIGDGVKTIGKKAFNDCASLTRVLMGKSVESIGDYAFYKDGALTELVIGENVKTIGTYAFSDCSGLVDLVIPNKVETIGKFAFRNCTNLKTVKLGNGLQTVGESAFFACEKLKSVIIPASVKTIQKYAFRKCFDLQSVTVLNPNTEILNHAFYGCDEATLYLTAEKAGETWGPRWNSSYRPIVWSCTLSADGTYVQSFVRTATAIENEVAIGGISAPRRIGYTFRGWALSENGEIAYTAENVYTAPEGTTLYSLWDEGEPVEPEEVPEEGGEEGSGETENE